MDSQRILLMYANEYDMKTDNGDLVKGCTINYFFSGQNCEMLKTQYASGGSIGYQRAKCSLDYEKREKIYAVPGIYDAQFMLTVGSDGKPVLKAVDLDYVGEVKFSMVQEKDKPKQ
jgi:hypothetical protein